MTVIGAPVSPVNRQWDCLWTHRLKASKGCFTFHNYWLTPAFLASQKLHALTDWHQLSWQVKSQWITLNFECTQSAGFVGSSSTKVITPQLIQLYSWFTHAHAVISLECQHTHPTQAEPWAIIERNQETDTGSSWNKGEKNWLDLYQVQKLFCWLFSIVFKCLGYPAWSIFQ